MANSARRLSLFQIQGANSGHPGAALGAADIMTTIFANHLRFDPKHPDWPERDRFVLSMGHASALLYSVLHLSGYDISMEDLKKFRRINSKTPGHPEVGTPGVEAATGPLGQGFAMGAGMALAARHQGIKNHTYIMCSDGDLMEGVTQEAISIAGLQKLNRLIVLWDDNEISIDGRAQMNEDQVARFRAAGWNSVRIDGHDCGAIDKAIAAAKKSDKPTFIACRTIIGIGSKWQGAATVHGNPLEDSDAVRLVGKLTKESDDGLWKKIKTAKANGKRKKANGRIKVIIPKVKDIESTRAVSGVALESIVKKYGGSIIGATADLAGSTSVLTSHNKNITSKNPSGNFIEFGVREHAMAAAMNGIALCGIKTFCSTFLVFSDYMRPAIRLAAIMKVPQIFALTHDSIGLGEDGETHQPVEHLESLRAMPNINLFRPCSAAEVAFAWEYALNSKTIPTAIALSRQKFQIGPAAPRSMIEKGGYVIDGKELNRRHVTIIATGSEVAIAIAARKLLAAQKISAAVVSMHCVELFRAQSDKYRESVLRRDSSIVISLEAGAANGWHEFADFCIGVDKFGLSGSGAAVMEAFGFTPEKVASRIIGFISK